ncbi:TIR domain-containing protein [uncultured Eudoraea sp.]|uniref:TIR domain-containing protein n=1 Tax=uncultured Eudoraea sp. TaxID=1035614 RepID=UPI002631F6A9|nr:TIR domain-containing protein [uncultured Eudoraea sp.]
MGRKINIFVIYALADKDIMIHLLRHLDPLNEAFDLSIWHDDPIIAGQPWKTYIESRIHHTDIFLLLVSDDFMNSQFIKQIEFKAIIDRHKENKSVVIPIIIDNCQWDIDLKLTDYDINLNELQILPEEGKPIGDWDSADLVYNNVAAGIRTIITPFVDNLNQEEPKKEIEKKAANDISEEQVVISSAKEEETDSIAGEGTSFKEEIDAVEENRLWEEAEAKRRAEAAKRIMEEAEASAKRRAEEDRLWEEAVAKRRAEKEKRIREEVEASANIKTEEKKKSKEDQVTRRNAGEENRDEETAEAATILRAEQQKIRKEEVDAKLHAEEENRIKLAAEANGKVEGTQQGKDTNLKKRVLTASLAAVLIVAVIWAFSVFNKNSERPLPTSPKINAADIKDSTALEKTSIDSLNKVATLTKLVIGDIHNQGIIFAINPSNNTGKIAHLEDAGPMAWQNAAKIHEQLGEGWRLPTFDELRIMYQTIGQGATNSGEFADELYWSATAYDDYQARLIRFQDGNTSYHYNKNVEHRKFKVRAIRDFRR